MWHDIRQVIVSGSFDDLRSPQVRFLEEAARLGEVHVLLWSDSVIQALEGRPPKFPEQERLYFVQCLRYVSRVTLYRGRVERDALPQSNVIQPRQWYMPLIWVVPEAEDNPRKRTYCASMDLGYHVVKNEALQGFPAIRYDALEPLSKRKKVVVTGCYDWLHSGHVRFFEEVSGLGDLYVVVGHDENIRLLKGEGHPLLAQAERRYMVQSIRFVKQAFLTSGMGWMDAEPEIAVIQPDIYAVNEDGDKPEKREFCAQHGIQYVVLKRTPKPGLPKRESTALRGF